MTGPLIATIDDALCSSLVDLMRSIGYRAEPYYSAKMFLTSGHLFSSHRIVADVHMPGMSGFDLIRRLHEQGITTPVFSDEYPRPASWTVVPLREVRLG